MSENPFEDFIPDFNPLTLIIVVVLLLALLFFLASFGLMIGLALLHTGLAAAPALGFLPCVGAITTTASLGFAFRGVHSS